MTVFFEKPDLWERLAGESRPIVLWGTGNGADKILDVCAEHNIPVSGIFASDGFVRDREFRGFRVTSWAEIKARHSAELPIVLMAFGSSRPEVLENACRITKETTLYAPDVPTFGEGLFTRRFAMEHCDEIFAARTLLADEESRRIFDLVLDYKLTGKVEALFAAVSDEAEVEKNILHPETVRVYADLGAYTGDTVRRLAKIAPDLKTVFAVEPDERNFCKLAAYAAAENRFCVLPVRAAAWSGETVLEFDGSGNRNAGALQNRSAALKNRPAKIRQVLGRPLDALVEGAPVDLIKYDVEGSEREALEGSVQTILRSTPTLLVSAYHRVEDLFALPLLLHEKFPFYSLYLRRQAGIPAWDLNLWAVKNKGKEFLPCAIWK